MMRRFMLTLAACTGLTPYGIEPAMAQDLGSAMMLGLGQNAAIKGAEAINEAPEQIQDFLNEVENGKEFATTEECLGALQVILNAAALAANVLPFSLVTWSDTDDMGPSGDIRLMLNGERIHVLAYCDGSLLKGLDLDWENGRPVTPQPVAKSSLDALLGGLLLLQLQGAFEDEANPQANGITSND